MSHIRVLLVDDHDLVRSGLRMLLEQTPQIRVAAEASSGQEAVDMAESVNPDVILMDLTMPGMNGLEAAAKLAQGRPPRRVIVLSGHGSPTWVRRALRAGARGYILKTGSARHFGEAVLDVHRGGTWFSPEVQSVIASFVSDPELMQRDPLDRLSGRQRAVLQLVAEGKSNREIAGVLGITESTVDTHRTELMRRLDLHDVASVVRFACQEGIVGID